MSYCPKCGNTGVLIDGTPCDCRAREEELFTDVNCLQIPETYRGLKFQGVLLPGYMGEVYKNTLCSYYEQIVSLRWKCRNIVICSPHQTGKSIFAYSAMQELFRKGVDVFQLFDILEIKRIMQDIEYNRSQSLGIDNPMDLFLVPYLFVYLPPVTNYDTYDTAAMLLARRVRWGNSTIFLYEGTWNQLVYNDSKGSLRGLKGNGSLTTVEVSSWENPKKGENDESNSVR